MSFLGRVARRGARAGNQPARWRMIGGLVLLVGGLALIPLVLQGGDRGLMALAVVVGAVLGGIVLLVTGRTDLKEERIIEAEKERVLASWDELAGRVRAARAEGRSAQRELKRHGVHHPEVRRWMIERFEAFERVRR